MTPLDKAKMDLRLEVMALRNDIQTQINALVDRIRRLEQLGTRRDPE